MITNQACRKRVLKGDLVGFGKPNDLAAVVLRAKLARRFGLLGVIPMWGGQRLHQFYPPLSTVVVRYFSMTGALILYLLLSFIVWASVRNVLAGGAFVLSYFCLVPLLYTGRFPEALGYLFVTLAYFTRDSFVSGTLLGLSALSHPLPGLFGMSILLTKRNLVVYLVAIAVCGWWYAPFLLRRNRLPYLQEKRGDKIFGIYLTSWAMVFFEATFLLLPWYVGGVLGILWWLSPIYIDRGFRIRFGTKGVLHNIRFILRKPLLLCDMASRMPLLRRLEDLPSCFVLVQRSTTQRQSVSIANWVWAVAAYLLEFGTIVYNGLPATEVATEHLEIPAELQVFTIVEDQLIDRPFDNV